MYYITLQWVRESLDLIEKQTEKMHCLKLKMRKQTWNLKKKLNLVAYES